MKALDRQLLIENIHRAADEDFAAHKVFGAAYWVCQQGQEPVEMCFGTTAPDSKTPVTGRTLFRIASMTKPVTAVAMLLLADRGLLSLSDPLSKFLPGFHDMEIIETDADGTCRHRGKAHTDPTILQVLSHTAGIGGDLIKQERMAQRDRQTLDATLSFLSRAGLDFEPGSKQQYNSAYGFDALVKIAEIVTGTSYLQFLTDEILAPLGMKDTTFIPSAEQWNRLVAMHDQVEGQNREAQTIPGCVFLNCPCSHFLGGAGLVSTLKDYAAFAWMLLRGGMAGNRRLLSSVGMSAMCAPQVSRSIMPGGEQWGIGVRVITGENDGGLPVGSFGWCGKFGSYFWIDPVNCVAAVYMKNSLVDGGSANSSARRFKTAVMNSYK